MKNVLFVIIALCTLVTPLLAQPALDWMRTYDAGGVECFFDIYATENGDFAMCGSTGDRFRYGGRIWVVRIDEHGNVIWSRIFGENTGAWARSLIEADNGDFVTAGKSTGIANTARVFATRIEPDGDQVWNREYSSGECRAIIELKDGNFLLVGESNRQGYLLVIAPDGEPILEETYSMGDQQGAYGYFTSMRETDGEVVIAGEGRRNVQELWHIWLLKINLENGEIIWERHQFAGRHSSCNTIITHPQGGFGLSGNSMGANAYLMKVDDQGEEDWTRIYDNEMSIETGYCLAVLDNGEFAIIGKGNGRDGYLPLVIRTFSDGNERWRGYYDFINEEDGLARGINELFSGVLGHDNSLIVAGTHNTPESEYDGIVFKAEPSIIGPYLLSWTPEDTVLSVLPGDSIQFIVDAGHQWNMALEYEWTLTGLQEPALISEDTSVVVHFDNLGDFLVSCHVTDREITTTITWHIDVTELYISEYQPDSLILAYRRNQEVDFSVTVRAVEDGPIEYLWLLDEEEIGEDDNVTVNFNPGREHSVQAIAFRGEYSDNVIWQAVLQELIVDWWPEPFAMTVPVDTVMQFAVDPLDPEADSLSILWTLNDDSVSSDLGVFLEFDELGQHQVIVYAADSVDNDTLIWDVLVVDPNAVEETGHHIPDQITLYPPVPNPFNSQATVRYALPTSGQVRLELYDITGRSVATLVNHHQVAGEHSTVINGADMTSGIYIIRMVADGETHTRKVLLVE
ncbi:MAG: T9SS type A sorting domain-containing protein [Candidatus Electryoneaceae bacterium]|nr:T9SS type A sorting domain-containing protein [Candidatus Electryoneaceae bacterium]